jgi:hypothetical protein
MNSSKIKLTGEQLFLETKALEPPFVKTVLVYRLWVPRKRVGVAVWNQSNATVSNFEVPMQSLIVLRELLLVQVFRLVRRRPLESLMNLVNLILALAHSTLFQQFR